MKNLREQKYIALMAIVVLFMTIVGLISFGQIDKYKGKVKVSSAKITAIDSKMKASINDLSGDNATQSAGYDEINYTVSYKIESTDALTRNVVIKATLPEDEKYSSFKVINSNNITSTLSSNKKEIELHISNVTTNENHQTVVKMLIQGAPNGYKVTPSIQIKEDTEANYTSVTVNEVEVKTNSLTGKVKDQDGMAVSGIELIIKKNNQEVKSTYTDENGNYVFSGVEEGTYVVEVDEEVYEKVSQSNVQIKDSSSLDITVKQVVPYKIHTDKFITSVTITNNGKTQKYTYGQIRRVQQVVKNLKEMTGEVEYKIVVSNEGKKEGMITVVKDELPEGLSFDKKKNADWEEKDGILYNRSLEGITLKGGEKREEKLVLDIAKTNEAKIYINKVTAKGEIYEKVVFILDGEKYKEVEVLEGETVKEEYIDNENFSGWYIDRNYTNKYNFKNPVRKDLILYGKTEAPVVKYKVTFNDKNPETGEITKWDEQEVKEGDTAEEPEDPEHTGYTFKCWEDDEHNVWDFATPITSALVLTSCYDKNVYDVNFYDYNNNLVKTLKVKYKETIDTTEVPVLPEVGHTFKGWYEAGQLITFDFTTLITRNVDLYPKHEINKNAVTFDDENRITTQEVDYGATATEIDSLGKEGHTFSHWSLERNSEEHFDFTTPIIEPTTLYAVYHINVYPVTFIDKDPANPNDEGTRWGDVQNVEHGGLVTSPETNPSKTGYTFNNWKDETGHVWDFATDTVTKPTVLVSSYNINKYTVTYMDDGNLYTKQENIPYNTMTTAPAEEPTKENKSFAGWSLDVDADPIVNFDFENTPITGDITLHSHYVDILPPDISHTPTEWTRNSVTVTIGKEGHPEYRFKYKIDTGSYQDYVGPFTVDENCTIVAKSVVGTQESVTTTHPITNIDKIPPVISSFTDTGISTTGFTVSVTAGDGQSGLKYIRLYKDDVLETTITFNEYELREGTGTHEFTDLEEQTTYRIKAIAVDAVGNESEAIEKEIKTEYRIVARIIGRENSLYESEDMYENFPSLDSAIKACPTGQCTIQMVLSTNESVQVLEGQDVTLDLNGKTVTGVIDGYTLKNGGNFQLVDWAETPGSIVNTNGIALYNEVGATLTLGELEEELVVSTQVPYVNGGTTGVYNASLDRDHTGIFKFYDGKVAGTVAIDGHVTETPYLYNANVVASEDRQVATLTQLAEAEARLRGVYYTKLQQAIDDAENGYHVEGTTDTDLLKGFKKLPSANYGFVYDEENNNLVSGNNTKGSSAISYTIIDLTNYEKDQELLITGQVLPQSYSGYTSTVEIKEGNETGNTINYISNNTYGTQNIYSFNNFQEEPSTVQYILEKGKKYYVKLTHTIGGTSDSSEESDLKTIISNMTLNDYELENLSINPDTDLKTSEVTQYGFEYDSETKTIKSNNQYVTATAFSYIELDLTNSEEDKELIVNANLDSMYSSHYGMINVSEDNAILYSDSYSALGYMYANYYESEPNIHNAGTRNYTKVLTKGKKYYLQFYYLKNYSSNYTQEQYEAVGCKDQFTINSIDLVPIQKTGTSIDLSTALVTPGDYGWYDSGYNYSQNNNSSNATEMIGSTAHSYIKVDMTEETVEKMMKIRLYSSQANFYAVVNNSTDLPSSSDVGKFADANSYYINDYNNYQYANLKPGQINYVHFVYKRNSTDNYGTSISIYEASIIEGHSYNLSKDLKTNNKGFTEKYNSDNSYYTGNTSQGNTYDSYIKVDLTNATTDQVFVLNAKISSGENYRYMYITTNDKDVDYSVFLNNRNKSLLFYNSYRENSYYVSGNSIYYDYHDYKYVLPKGNVYYIHYALYAKGSSSYDNSYIKSAMYYPVSTNDLNIGTLPHQKGTGGLVTSDYVEEDGTTDANFRYVGNNPKNYVTFNNETWRIIGIFDTKDENGNTDKRIKLVRNESLGNGYAYDSTPYAENDQSINAGLGINEWSQADLMKLLNPGYDNNQEETFECSYDSTLQKNVCTSNGTKNVNNSLYWNKASGTCITNSNNAEKSCDFTTIGLDATSKSMIDTVVWNTGAIPYNNSNYTGLSLYTAERGNQTTKSSTYESTTGGIDDTVERKTTWTGKVGLLYASDYILASGDFYSGPTLAMSRSQCIGSTSYTTCTYSGNNSNWLSKDTSPVTLLSPVYGQNSGGYNAPLSYVAYAITSISSMPAIATNYVTRPVVYLDPKVKVKSGDGSQGDPFIFEMGENKNTTKNYGLINESSEDDDDSFIEETETDDYENLITEGRKILGFDYDAETSTFTNQNKGVPDSMSVAYATFDLTNAQEDKQMIINYSLSKSGNANAYLNLLKGTYKAINYNEYTSYNGSNDDNNTSLLSQSSTNIENKQLSTITLEKGYKYYLQFAYDKKNSEAVSDSNKDEFSIKVDFEEPAETVTNYTRYDGITPVLNQVVDTVEMLRDISLTTALTIEDTRDMILDLNGHSLTTSQNTYTITNNGSLKVIDSKYSEEIEAIEDDQDQIMNAYNQEKEAAETAAAAEYNALSKDDYIENDIKLNLSAKDHGEEEGKWKDLSGNNNDFTINNTAFDSEDGALVFDDENDFATGELTEPEESTFEITFSATSDEASTLLSTIGIGNTISLPKTCTYAELSTGASCGSVTITSQGTSKKFSTYTTSLEQNKVYTLQILTSATNVYAYLNGTQYYYSNSTNNSSAAEISKLILGRLTEEADSTFKGKIYSIRMYDRQLQKDEMRKNYRIDQKLYNASYEEDTSYNSKTLINNTFGYTVKDFSGDTIADTTSGSAYISSTYSNGGYVPCISFTNSNSSNTNNTALITEELNFDTSYRYLQFDYTYRVYNASYPVDIYMGLTKQNNFTSIDDFEVYEKITANNASATTKNITLKPTEIGKYRLKIVYVKTNSSSRVYTGVIYNLVLNKGEPVDLETRISTELNQTGEIVSTTNSTILNNEGANLEIEEGVINLKKSGTTANPLYGIINKGYLTLGKRSEVNATGYAYTVGVLNDTTGDMLDGEATIRGSLYSLHNRSTIDKNIKGYTFKSAQINNESQNTLTLEDALITDYGSTTAILDNTTRKLTIKNSVIKATVNSDYVLNTTKSGGIIEIEGSEIIPYTSSNFSIAQGNTDVSSSYSWSNVTAGTLCKNYIIKDSTVTGIIHNHCPSGEIEIINSNTTTVQSITGKTTIERSKISNKIFNASGDLYIKNSDLSNISNAITNASNVRSGGYMYITNRSKINSISNYNYLKIENSEVSSIYNHGGQSYSTGRNTGRVASTRGKTYINDSTVTGYINVYNGELDINGITMNNKNRTSSPAITLTLDKYSVAGSYSTSNVGSLAKIDGIVNISGYSTGISATGSGSLTIGTNDGTVGKASLKIDATDTGITSSAPFYWYDGSIRAKVDKTILNYVSSFPTGYDIDITEEEDGIYETAFLTPIDNHSYVAQIGNTQYMSLQDAFDAVPEDNTETEVKLIKKLVTLQRSTLEEGKNVKLNFDDNKMTYYNGSISNEGTLKLFDDTDEVTKQNYTYNSTLIHNSGTLDYNNIIFNKSGINNEGTLTINSGNLNELTISNTKDLVFNGGILYKSSTTASGDECNVTVNNVTSDSSQITSSGTLTVLGGTYKDSTNSSITAFKTTGGGTATITAGTYESSLKGIIDNAGTTTIEGIESSSKTIGTSTGTLILTNNTFDNMRNSTGLTSSGFVTFNSGSYSSEAPLISSTSGKLTINDTEFSSTSTGISSSGNAKLLINDINIDTTGTAITIESSGETTILHGTIKSGDRGISNTINGTGEITIGQKGFNDEEETELVSTTDPEISGTNFGFANGREATVIKFYDGIIKGANPINSNINEVEDGYEVVGNPGNTEKWLGKLPVIRNIDQGIDYYDIQKAINEAGNGETLQFLREVTGLTTTSTYTVSAEKNLIIDLNGKKIIQNNEKFIDNEGTLKLTNSNYSLSISDTYKITSSGEGFLYNTGKTQMITNSGDLTLEKIVLRDATEGNVITNTGTLTMNNSQIEDLTSGVAITNTGTLTMDTVTISSADSTVNDTTGKNIVNNGGTVTITKGILSSKKGNSITSSGTNPALSLTKVKIGTTNGNIIDSTNGTVTIDTALLTTTSVADNIAIKNTGSTLTADNVSIDVTVGKALYNTGIASFENSTMTSSDNYQMIENTNELTIKNSTIKENTSATTTSPRKDNDLITSSKKLTLEDTDITRTNDYYYCSGCRNRYYYVFPEEDRNNATLIHSTDEELSIKGGTFGFSGGYFTIYSNTSSGTYPVNIQDATVTGYGGIRISGSWNTSNNIVATIKDTNVNVTAYALSTSYVTTTVENGTYTSKGQHWYKSYNGNSTGRPDEWDYDQIPGVSLSGGGNTLTGVTIPKPTSYSRSFSSTGNYTTNLNNTTIGGEVYTTNSTMNIKGGTINSVYGEKPSSYTPTINIKTGTITNSVYADSCNIVLGTQGDTDENDDLIVSISDPSIGSVTGKLYFYDGIIRGILSTPTARETGYNIKNTTGGHHLTKDPFIKNTSTNTEYNNLRTAVREVQDGETLQIIDNQDVYENDGEAATIPSTSTVTFDLNGKTLNIKSSTFTNQGTLNVVGNGTFTANNAITNQGIMNISNGNIAAYNSGTVNITGGTLTGTTNQSAGTVKLTSGSISKLTNQGTLIVDGGTASTVTNATTGNVTVNGGTLTGFTNNGTVTFNDGTIEGGLTNNSVATMTIKDGTLKSTINNIGSLTIEKMALETSASFANTGTLVADDLTGTVSNLGTNTKGSMTINNANLTLTGGITVNLVSGASSSTVNINNGTFDINTESTSSFARAINGIINLNGVTITSKNPIATAAGGTININSGSYTTSATSAVEVSNGTVNIGNKDTNVSVSNPVITAASYAVYQTNGNVNFYDGKLIGNSAPVYGRINEYEPGYKLSISHPDETYIGTLTPIGDDERVAVLNGINFTDLQQAINAARDNEEQNIVLYANITLNDNIVVPATKIINVYLNGYTINRGDYTITNNGTFELKEGTPSSLGANIVENIKDALNISDRTKNVIIYEMEDGSQLSAENVYTLYKKANSEYQLMTMERGEEIGRYVIGRGQSEMTTVRGRLYIENLTSGEYKVKDNKGKEISFTIDDDLKVTGNVIENNRPSTNENLVSTAIAELIIAIQTGITRINYLVLITIMLGIIGVLYLINRKKGFE